jgi:hypothetical protein
MEAANSCFTGLLPEEALRIAPGKKPQNLRRFRKVEWRLRQPLDFLDFLDFCISKKSKKSFFGAAQDSLSSQSILRNPSRQTRCASPHKPPSNSTHLQRAFTRRGAYPTISFQVDRFSRLL